MCPPRLVDSSRPSLYAPVVSMLAVLVGASAADAGPAAVRGFPVAYHDDACRQAVLLCKYNASCAHSAGTTRIGGVLITGTGASGTTATTDALRRLGARIEHEKDVPGHELVSWAARCPQMLSPPERIYIQGGVTSGDDRVTRLFRVVAHQVRHPLNVIKSFSEFARHVYGQHTCSAVPHPCWKSPYTLFDRKPRGRLANRYRRIWAYILHYTPWHGQGPRALVRPESRLEPDFLVLVAKHWLTWNEQLEAVADVRYRVEDTPPAEICALLARHLGSPLCPAAAKSGEQPRAAVNPRHHGGAKLNRAPTWAELRRADAAVAELVAAKAREYGYAVDDIRIAPNITNSPAASPDSHQ